MTIFRRATALYLALYLVFPLGMAGDLPKTDPSLRKAEKIAEMSYLEILEDADELQVSESDVKAMKRYFRKDQEAGRNRLKEEIKQLENQEKSLRSRLTELNDRASRDSRTGAQMREDLHCEILQVQKKLGQVKIQRDQTLKVEYENNVAKAELAHRWPKEYEKILEQLETGKARGRRHGNVEDIGVRVIRQGQEDDVEQGQKAIREMKERGVLPPEVEDGVIDEYLSELGKQLSANSDLTVPLKITVLNSDEINAFALPGGYLFLNSGLILKAENESELAGVIAHEIAHMTARHGNRLMRKASIANVLFQSAQIAALILGPAGAFASYALQYGFMGAGLVISLALLGVSRDFELEADQLGAQYLWKSGYDPRAFVTFFDKMANDKGHVRSTSFFRTHPAFAERLIEAFREIKFLPARRQYVSDTPAFERMHDHLEDRMDELKKKRGDAPRLKRSAGPGCDEL